MAEVIITAIIWSKDMSWMWCTFAFPHTWMEKLIPSTHVCIKLSILFLFLNPQTCRAFLTELLTRTMQACIFLFYFDFHAHTVQGNSEDIIEILTDVLFHVAFHSSSCVQLDRNVPWLILSSTEAGISWSCQLSHLATQAVDVYTIPNWWDFPSMTYFTYALLLKIVQLLIWFLWLKIEK